MASRSKESYLAELLDLRDKLKVFLAQIQEGKTAYYKEVSLKLRIMYCRKSGTAPLLSTIEDLYGFEVFVAITYSIQEQVRRGLLPASLADGLVFEQNNVVTTWFESGHELVRIFDALDREDILSGNQRFTYRHLIEVAADKLGGAHVDAKVPEADLALHSDQLLINGLPVAQRALYDTAATTIAMIDALETHVTKGARNDFFRDKPSAAASKAA